MRRPVSLCSCWLGLLGSVALASCSAVVEPDIGDLGPRPSVCQPGDLNPFVCADSAIVFQECNEEGGFDPAPPCPPAACNPRATWPCLCPDGSTLTRTCLPEAVWPPCPCTGTTSGTAGMTAPAPGG